MKKYIFIMAVVIIGLSISESVFAMELTGSGRLGGAKVYSAETLSKNTFSIGFQEEYFSNKRISFDGKNNVLDSQLFLGHTPITNFSLFLNRKSLLNNNIKAFSLLHSIALYQTELGFMLSKGLSKSWTMGFEPTYVLFNGTGTKFFESSSAGIRLLNTLKTSFGKEQSDIRFHFNVQYFMNEGRNVLHKFPFENFSTKTLYGLSQFYSVNYGVGIEMDLPVFNTYLEYSLDQMLKSHIPFFKNPNRLNTGIKFHIVKNSPWLLHLGGQFGFAYDQYEMVTPTPNALGFIGLSYKTQTKKKQAFPIAKIKKEKKKFQYPIYPIETKTVEAIQTTDEVKTVKAIAIPTLPTPIVRYAKPKTAPQTKYVPEETINEDVSEQAVFIEEPNTANSLKAKARTRFIPSLPTERSMRQRSQSDKEELFPDLKNKNSESDSSDRDFQLHFR